MRRALTIAAMTVATLALGTAAAQADGPVDALGGLGGLTNLDPSSLGIKAPSAAAGLPALGQLPLSGATGALGGGLPLLG